MHATFPLPETTKYRFNLHTHTHTQNVDTRPVKNERFRMYLLIVEFSVLCGNV